MTKRRIKEVANFFYSSDSSQDVPLRISAECGMSGFSIPKEGFIELLNILNHSINLKGDLENFRKKYG